MDDDRVWALERSLWTGGEAQHRACVDPEALVVVPAPPYLMDGKAAVESIAGAPRWAEVAFAEGRIARPQDGLIIVAYRARARHIDQPLYEAWCTTTYRRLADEEWRLVQHQQTLAPAG